MRGRVVAFGSDGWGTVRDETGVEHRFHSTAIADGSRAIAVDAIVEFRLVPGRQGRWEADQVTPVGG